MEKGQFEGERHQATGEAHFEEKQKNVKYGEILIVGLISLFIKFGLLKREIQHGSCSLL